ncbi:MAG: hypothetical protein HOO96_06380 [Polyangiaceae bacterium]|nr:hypothetical protein [Polyangiaceae bacterium]
MKRRSSRTHDDVLDLLARIHRVNPTGRGLGSAESMRRYHEKSRLQSELLERFPDEVGVQAHVDMPGVVSLSLPRHQMSAGHAVLDQLTSAARTRVDAALERDDAPPPLPARAATRQRDEGRVPGASDLLERALEARASYDFECAEAALREALTGPPSVRARALFLLLTLLVDDVARDADALELAGACNDVDDGRCFALLGTAAARNGDDNLALTYLARAVGERAVRSCAAILDATVHRDDRPTARAALEILDVLAVREPSPMVGELQRNVRRSVSERWFGSETCTIDEDLLAIGRVVAPRHPAVAGPGRASAGRAGLDAAMLVERLGKAQSAGDRRSVACILRRIDASSDAREDRGRPGTDRVELARRWLADATEQDQLEALGKRTGEGDVEGAAAILEGAPALASRLGSRADPRLRWFAALRESAPDLSFRTRLRAARALFLAGRGGEEQWSTLARWRAILERARITRAEIERLDRARPGPPPNARSLIADGPACMGATTRSTTERKLVRVAGRALRIRGREMFVSLECAGDAGWLVFRPLDAPNASFRHEVAVGVVSPDDCHVSPNEVSLKRRTGAPIRVRIAAGDARLDARIEEGATGGRAGAATASNGTPGVLRVWGTPLERYVELRQGAHDGAVSLVGEDGVARALPVGIRVRGAIASPIGASPILLADILTCAYPSVGLLWQPRPPLWRSFEAFKPSTDCSPGEVVSVERRGVCFTTQPASDNERTVHVFSVEGGELSPLPVRTSPHHLALVGDLAGRSCWLVGRAPASNQWIVERLSFRG